MTMTILSYLTLSDGTLVDFEQHDDVLTIRAGKSATPSERPIVFVINQADANQIALHLAGYLANCDPLGPDGPEREVDGLDEFVARGQRTQVAIDGVLARIYSQARLSADAEAAYHLFAQMPTRELDRLLVAHDADLSTMTTPSSIVFSAGRIALIRHVIKGRMAEALTADPDYSALQDEIKDGTRGPLTLVLRPTTALQLAALVALAVKHPSIAETPAAVYSGKVVLAHIREYFADAPSIQRLMLGEM